MRTGGQNDDREPACVVSLLGCCNHSETTLRMLTYVELFSATTVQAIQIVATIVHEDAVMMQNQAIFVQYFDHY